MLYKSEKAGHHEALAPGLLFTASPSLSGHMADQTTFGFFHIRLDKFMIHVKDAHDLFGVQGNTVLQFGRHRSTLLSRFV